MLTLSGIHVQPTAPVNGSLKAIEAAIAYMRSTPAKTINLQRLASFVNVDPFHLSHLFTKHTGLNLKHFHQLIRLRAAKRVLAETTLSVTDVALECGYDSLGTFASTFKKAVGLTPSEFRTYVNRLDLPIISAVSTGLSIPTGIGDDFRFANINALEISCGVVFAALCAISDGSVLNCAIAPFEGKTRLSFPRHSTEPHVALAAFYPSNMTIKIAAIEGPVLVGRSCAIVADELDLTLRPPTPVDPPFISALPIMAIRRFVDLRPEFGPMKIEATVG
jgi:AraC-like DNA-binding protein